MLATYCGLLSRLAEAESAIAREGAVLETVTGHRRPSPWVHIASKCVALLATYGAELGLSPAARSRVKVDDEKLGDEFQRYLDSHPA